MTIRSRTMLMLLTMLALIAVTAPIGLPLAAQDTVRLIAEFNIPNSSYLKQPKVATFKDQVYAFGVADANSNAGGRARLWTKSEAAPAFPAPFDVGTTTQYPKDPLYVNAGITTTPAGDVITIWVDQAANIIYSRRRDPSGTWGPIVEVTRREIFAWEPALTVVTGGPQNGRIIAVWRDDEVANADNNGIYYTFSDNNGASWVPVRRAFAMKVFRTSPVLASGPNGEVALTFIRDAPRPIHVMLAMWTGDGFSVPVDINAGSDMSFTDSTVAIYNDRIYVGYRHVDQGIYYVEKPLSEALNNQPWPRATLLNEHGDGRVMVVTDRLGNLHITWIRRATVGGSRNQNRIGYAVRLADGRFFGPIESTNNGTFFNPWAAASTETGIYLHAVYDAFSGDIPIPRYALFRAPGSPFGSSPLIEGGVARVGGDGRTTVKVTFPDLSSIPQSLSVRWRWGAPPTDTENDSGGWVLLSTEATSSTELTVPIPPAFLTANDCTPRALFTQLRRNSDNVVETVVRNAAVTIDTTVVASVEVGNPIAMDPSSWYDGNFTVRDLDPNSTPVPQVMLMVHDGGDCNGLARVQIANNSAALAFNSDLDVDGDLTAIIPLPGFTFLPPSPDGMYPVVVRVYDKLGNSKTVTTTIRLDRTPPQLALSGSEVITATDSPLGDILQDLTFDLSSATITETNGIHGLMLAVSPTPVTSTVGLSSLRWIFAPATASSGRFTVSSWSMANAPGVTMATTSATEQTFFIYALLIDRAGNISSFDTVLETTATSTLTPMRTYLPLVNR